MIWYSSFLSSSSYPLLYISATTTAACLNINDHHSSVDDNNLVAAAAPLDSILKSSLLVLYPSTPRKVSKDTPQLAIYGGHGLASTPKHGVMPPLYWWPTDDACSVSGRWRRLAWATCHGHNRCMGWSINWWSNTIGIPLSSSSVINTTCCGRCTTLALVESSSCTRRRRDGDSADCNNDITRWQHICD